MSKTSMGLLTGAFMGGYCALRFTFFFPIVLMLFKALLRLYSGTIKLEGAFMGGYCALRFISFFVY